MSTDDERPDEKKPDDEKKKTPNRGPGPRTLQFEAAQVTAVRQAERADEALDEERDARRELVDTIKDQFRSQIQSLERQLADEKSRSRNLMRVLTAEGALILMMFGVAAGVVQWGTVKIPGIGSVEVGPSGEAEAPETVVVEPPAPAPARRAEGAEPEPVIEEDTGDLLPE
jgi:hypothetical protein